jgi:hypothetical protein
MTPAQARALAHVCVTRQLRADSCLEYCELLAERLQQFFPRMAPLGEVVQLRAAAREARQSARHARDLLLALVERDEQVNGWKGEDREVEVLPD